MIKYYILIHKLNNGGYMVNSSVSENQLVASNTLTPNKFRISSGLKNLIGSELITSDSVAIFELVKNSFDAGATQVDLYFFNDNIYIIDNGKGMTYDDLINKWLFVAYSAKKDGSEDEEENKLNQETTQPDYRSNLKARKIYAGSKGVGRFSCDRLGSFLCLQTRSRHTYLDGQVQRLQIDWDKFEENDKKEFVDISIDYSTLNDFIVNDRVDKPKHGTILCISKPRSNWNRENLLNLKAGLAKLINPFGGEQKDFQINIHAKEQEIEDNKLSHFEIEGDYVPVVNGPVKNLIFSVLQERTAHLDVSISHNGLFINSSLIDRGELIYSIKEPNPFNLLKDSQFRCDLYYLNTAAKQVFARRMGLPVVQFGSIFLFRNGFRVYPIGEPGEDSFGLDWRKQQGHSRYLGTREIIGRIDVSGTEEKFKEATSRDKGLIETPALKQLRTMFLEKVVKRLENYVVNVNWADKFDKEELSPARLSTDQGKARIIDLISKLSNGKDIELISFSKNLVGILSEKAESFENSLEKLTLIANATKNSLLLEEIKKAEERYQDLKEAEHAAKMQAEKERLAREEAEKKEREAKKKQQDAEKAKEQAESEKEQAEEAYEEEKKRNLFLTADSLIDKEAIINMHHQIGIYATTIHGVLESKMYKISTGKTLSNDDVATLVEQVSFINNKILAISRFATKANFRLDSEIIELDIVLFIEDYIREICPFYEGDQIKIHINSDAGNGLQKSCRPIEISMLIDNLVNNAKKFGALEIYFEIMQPSKKEIRLVVQDNGSGLKQSIQDPDRIFEKGFSTTNGSGLGLYHAKGIVERMGGSIKIDPNSDSGLRLIIGIAA